MTPDKHTAKCPRCKRFIVQSKVRCPLPVTRVVTFPRDTPVHDVLRAMCGATVEGVEVTTTEEE